jgi:uncharacterized protein YacL
MILYLLRFAWVAFGAFFGYTLAASWADQGMYLAAGAAVGGLVGGLVILLEKSLRRLPFRNLASAVLGLLIGLGATRLILASLHEPHFSTPILGTLFYLGLPLLFGSLGWAIGIRKGREVGLSFFPRVPGFKQKAQRLLLDTSVIIDGRIADICETNFLQGTLAIPQFVLRELQHIADSSDPLKRARGRRGLDILKKIQDQQGSEVEILDQDFPNIRDVDGKLVEMAKELDAPIITNDFNLNKVAQLHGIRVLNINQLANALKPVVLPGEMMRVRVIKEGKEQGQGVGYLDDGTMVVVDNAKRFMGKSIDVAVTSVLQTTAGRMIFTMVKEEAEDQAQSARW